MPGALGRITPALLFVSCLSTQPAAFRGAEVMAGRYPSPTEWLRTPSPDDTLIARLRSTVESNRNDYLRRLGRRFFPIEAGVAFAFSRAATADSDGLILRYFGQLPRPGPFAGYSVQFLYDRARRTVTRIYVEQVPLE